MTSNAEADKLFPPKRKRLSRQLSALTRSDLLKRTCYDIWWLSKCCFFFFFFFFFLFSKGFYAPKIQQRKENPDDKKKAHSAHASDTKPLNLATLRLYKNWNHSSLRTDGMRVQSYSQKIRLFYFSSVLFTSWLRSRVSARCLPTVPGRENSRAHKHL